MRKVILLSFIITITLASLPLNAQSEIDFTQAKEPKKRAWEFGVGASSYWLTRFSILDIYKESNGNYGAKTEKKDVLFGGNFYVARELNDYFALDLQGMVGFTRDRLKEGKENRWVIKPEVGIQWRLGDYFNTKMIDPYLRASVGYMYKNFNIVYKGVEEIDEINVLWNVENLNNKEGADRRHMIPLSVGGGVNMWLNDRFGIGLQCMYVIKPYKHVANDVEASVRWMWRFGGKSKAIEPIINYVDIPTERVIEQIIEVPVYELLHDLINNIYFDFSNSQVTPNSYESLDKIAEVMKANSNRHFLIVGYTDAKGDANFNLALSEQRAKSVYEALVDRGVNPYQLKYRGVGMKVAIAAPTANEEIRQGDRKVGIEVINNAAYWDYIQ